MKEIKAAVILIAIVIGLFILHKFLLWCERKRWINYTRKISRDSIGDSMMELHAMLSPDIKKVIEVKQQKKQEEEDSGDPPDPLSEEDKE